MKEGINPQGNRRRARGGTGRGGGAKQYQLLSRVQGWRALPVLPKVRLAQWQAPAPQGLAATPALA